MVFVFRYFRSNLKNAIKEYPVKDLAEDSIIKKTYEMLKDYDVLRKADTAVDIVQERVREDIKKVRSNTRQDHTFTIEHLSTKVLARGSGNNSLWRDLIPCMPGDALIRHTGFLTNICVWAKQDAESQEVVDETVKGFKTRLHEFIQPPTDPGVLKPFTTKRPLHPFKLLIAVLQYQEKKASRWGQLSWIPKPEVTKVLHEAFEQSLGYNAHVISSKICVAIDVSGSMKSSGINGKPWTLKCQVAAQAVAFTLARMGSNVHLLAFNKNGYDPLEASGDFEKFKKDMESLSLQPSKTSDCTEPLKWAQTQEIKDIEAFVVFTVNKNVGKRNEVAEALKLYRDFGGKDDSKFIVCTMNATNISSGDTSDPHVFNVCGCDTNLSLLIQAYLHK